MSNNPKIPSDHGYKVLKTTHDLITHKRIDQRNGAEDFLVVYGANGNWSHITSKGGVEHGIGNDELSNHLEGYHGTNAAKSKNALKEASDLRTLANTILIEHPKEEPKPIDNSFVDTISKRLP